MTNYIFFLKEVFKTIQEVSKWSSTVWQCKPKYLNTRIRKLGLCENKSKQKYFFHWLAFKNLSLHSSDYKWLILKETLVLLENIPRFSFCFFFAIINNIVMNICVYILSWQHTFFLSDRFLETEFQDQEQTFYKAFFYLNFQRYYHISF